MRLRDLGEFGLIERIVRRAQRRGAPARAWRIGAGDDCAVMRPRPGEDLAVTTDALVEGAHFRWSTDTPGTLGRRALAAALSDLAATGARPLGVVLALEAPPDLAVRTLDAVLDGLLAAGRAFACPLVGGNVARAPRTALTLTALGAVRRGRALTRAAARVGDRLLVTGTLGGAALARVQAERSGRRLRGAPVPRLRAGQALARLGSVGACIDVSDGLLADLRHLLRASRVGAVLAPERVPRPAGFAAACARRRLDPEALSLRGGEDYELLFTLRPAGPSVAELTRRLGVRVTAIGRVTRRGLRLLPGAGPAASPAHTGRRRPTSEPEGWRHF